MTLRRLGEARPVGAVQCSDCGETKQNGYHVRFTISRDGMYPGSETEYRLLCDSCLHRLEDWYNARSDEYGYVTVN